MPDDRMGVDEGYHKGKGARIRSKRRPEGLVSGTRRCGVQARHFETRQERTWSFSRGNDEK